MSAEGPQAVATSMDVSDDSQIFKRYRSIRESEATTYGPHHRKRICGSFHDGLVHKPGSVQEALKIPMPQWIKHGTN